MWWSKVISKLFLNLVGHGHFSIWWSTVISKCSGAQSFSTIARSHLVNDRYHFDNLTDRYPFDNLANRYPFDNLADRYPFDNLAVRYPFGVNKLVS